MANEAPDTKPSLKRFGRFGLAAFLIFVAIFAVWFAYISNRAQRIKSATTAITRFDDGQVWYDYQYDGFSRIDDSEPSAPAWLVEILGEHYFVDVAKVSFQGEQSVTNKDLASIDMLTAVRRINLGYTPISDLSSLRNQSQLAWLDLTRTRIENDDIKHLRNLRKLFHLVIDDTALTDDGLSYLRDCTEIQRLHLNKTGITGTGFKYLAGNSIPEIELKESPVDDDGLRYITTIEGILDLSLDGTNVTDAGMEQLAKLTDLRKLGLQSTNISDASIPHLTKLVNLIKLDLRDTNISDEGARLLHASLPNGTIEWGKRRNRQQLLPGD